jgi:glycosyltransferase involved in cell wall biosynthesis
MTELPLEAPRSRVVFDATTSARWLGPPVGIVRVEQELASWALTHLGRPTFAFFDPHRRRYRHLKPSWAEPLITGAAGLNNLDLPEPGDQRARRSDSIPPQLRSSVSWILQLRRKLLQVLERPRLDSDSERVRRAAAATQRMLMSAKYRKFLFGDDGKRRPYLPLDMACDDDVELTSADTLVCVGAGWRHTDIRAIKEQKERIGFRLVILCHDIIPLMFPQFYADHDVETFRNYLRNALPIAELVVVYSRRGDEDLRAYCAEHQITIGRTAIVPLGARFAEPRADVEALPPGLERERYILFVSTIEPRKGHRMLYEVWLRLLAEGIPQRAAFKLVFVGRPGWMVEDLIHDLTTDARIADSLFLMSGIDDGALTALLRSAAFCVYPPVYEGYGLPVIEAFFHGKAVIASHGGSLPEVVGAFSPCLDPHDPEAWYQTMKAWILDPAARAPFEAALRKGFRYRTWDEAAGEFFAHALDPQDAPAQARSDVEPIALR